MPSTLYVNADASIATHAEFSGLHGRRFILPLDTRAASQGLQFFVPNPITRLLSRALQVGVADKYVTLNATLLNRISFGSFDVTRLVVSLGTVGPYSKYSILHLEESNIPQCLTKLACSVEASRLVAQEAKALQYLSTLEGMRGVPKLLGSFEGLDLAWVRQTVGRGSVWKQSDRIPICKFLNHLAKRTEIFSEFDDSKAYAVLSSRFLMLKKSLPREWSCRAEDAISALRTTAVGKMRFVYAHRDFTRWNIKNIAGDPYVYDWEYSEAGYPELYDLLHFLLMPIAIKGKISKRYLLQSVFPILRGLVPSIRRDNYLQWQLLFYMVDLSLFYLESNGGRDTGDRVVQKYGGMIDQILSGDW